MEIVTFPNPILKQSTALVTDLLAAKKLGVEMLKFMEASNGIGLAAPQIGESLQIFVASVTGKAKDGIIFINPFYVPLGEETAIDKEGCLSIPGVLLPIKRYRQVAVKYTSVDDAIIVINAQGLLARIIQHEFDHLRGILISDRFREQNEETTV